jgi:hypothetical protein
MDASGDDSVFARPYRPGVGGAVWWFGVGRGSLFFYFFLI